MFPDVERLQLCWHRSVRHHPMAEGTWFQDPDDPPRRRHCQDRLCPLIHVLQPGTFRPVSSSNLIRILNCRNREFQVYFFSKVLIESDAAYIAGMIIFSFTDGYLKNSCMMFAPKAMDPCHQVLKIFLKQYFGYLGIPCLNIQGCHRQLHGDVPWHILRRRISPQHAHCQIVVVAFLKCQILLRRNKKSSYVTLRSKSTSGHSPWGSRR